MTEFNTNEKVQDTMSHSSSASLINFGFDQTTRSAYTINLIEKNDKLMINIKSKYEQAI